MQDTKRNRLIQSARDVALNILKPSRKHLEHGLELHAQSLVCEAYGFAPRAAPDGRAIRKAVAAGASELELQDLLEEMRMTRYLTAPAERAEFVEAFDAAGVTCILENAGEECQDPLRLIKRLARYTYTADRLPGILRRGATPDDIVAAKQEGRRCLYLSGNGVPLAQDWHSLEEELGYIRIFFQLGCRMMHLTYNRRNMLGDGCAETADAGLSDFGRAAIAEMNRVGVIVDVAHAGWQTSLEAAGVSSRPVVASHTCCSALHPHYRCKPDKVIRAIVDSGGYIGIAWIGAFLGGRGDLSTVLDHVDYAVRRFGSDSVAIGTDQAYFSRNTAREEARIPRRRSVRPRWENFWRAGDPFFDPKWARQQQVLSLAWTNWPLFTVGLVQRGYADAVIQNIIGGNVLRVARAVFPRR
jgi:membrane dipeptidase